MSRPARLLLVLLAGLLLLGAVGAFLWSLPPIPAEAQRYVQASTDFSAALNAINATDVLVIPITTTIASTATVNATTTLRFEGGGQVSIATGITLNINGPIQAPRQRIFTGGGTVSFGHNARVPTVVYPEWWGAVPDGTTDNNASATGFLQSAINSFTGAGVIDFNEGAYSYSTGLTLTREIELRGQSRRGSGLFYNGAGGTAIYCNLTADSLYIHDLTLDNTNATPGAVGIDLDCERGTLARMNITPTKGFTTAVIRSGNGGAVFQTVLDNLTIAGKSIGQANAIGYFAVAGNAAIVRDVHFSGNNVGVRAGAAGTTVDNLNIRGSIFEVFDGVTGPGTTLGIGIDLVNVQGASVYGNKCEPNAANLLCLNMTTVDGAMITGNFFVGDGVTIQAASATSANTKGVVFVGNSFFSFTGQGINLVNGAQVDVGTNYLGTTTPVTMKSDRDITGHQFGAPLYSLQPGQGFSGYAVNFNPIFNKAAAGVHTDFATVLLQPPTMQGGAGTYTNAATLKITGAPVGATTRNYAVWVAGGQATFDGGAQVNGSGLGVNLAPPAVAGVVNATQYQLNGVQYDRGDAAPTCTSNCGAAPTVTGVNSAFRVTIGTGLPATPFLLIFSPAWTAAPACIAQLNSPFTTAASVTAANATTTGVQVNTLVNPPVGAIYAVHCHGVS